MDSEAKDLIDRISAISDSVKKDLKPLVQKLASNIAKNIKSPEIVNMAKLEGVNDPTEKDVARILNRLREKYNWTFSKTSLYSYIQSDLTIITLNHIMMKSRRNSESLKDRILLQKKSYKRQTRSRWRNTPGTVGMQRNLQ